MSSAGRWKKLRSPARARSFTTSPAMARRSPTPRVIGEVASEIRLLPVTELSAYLSKNGCVATGGFGAAARIRRNVTSSNSNDGDTTVTGR
jgi:hypothetical protein